VLGALSRSGRTVPHPAVWHGLAAPRLKAAGVRSEKAFQSGARSVDVERAGRDLQIEPSRNGGTQGDGKGFVPLPELTITLPLNSSAEALGEAVRAGLERCV